MMTIDKDGTVMLPDGRTVCTTAATQFTVTVPMRNPRRLSLFEVTRYEAAVRLARPLSTASAAKALAAGQTIAMFGTAEGRLSDGTVVTAERWWKVCAL